MRYDYSEPRYGKDMCDRILCPVKAAVRRYCNEGHDIVTAQDMQIALKERPVRGTTVAVFSVTEESRTLKIKKISNYSSLHNFEFTPDGLRMWKAYNIGIGKLISRGTIVLCSQQATCLTEEKPFFTISNRGLNRATTQKGRMDEYSDSFACPNPQCSEEFHSRSELETHLNMIAHHNPAGTVQRSLYDQLRIDWVQRFQSIWLDTKRQSRPDTEVEIATSTEGNLLLMSWALHKSRSGQTRFSDNVREYLQKSLTLAKKLGERKIPPK